VYPNRILTDNLELMPLESSRLRLPPSEYRNSEPPALLHYLHILSRRPWTVLLVTVGTLALAAVASFMKTPLYEAVARISVGRQNSNVLGFKDAAGNVIADEEDENMELDAQVKILESDSLVLKDLKKIGLAHPSEPSGDIFAGEVPIQELSERDAQLLHTFQSGLDVSRVGHTPIIQIKFLGPDPVVAAKFVNGLVSAYLDHNFRAKYEYTAHVSAFLSQQLEELKSKFEHSQEKLVDYEKRKGILGLDEKQNIVTEKLDELNRALAAAQAERIQKQALYERTVSTNPELVLEVGDNPNVQHLKEQQEDLKNQYAQATSDLGSAHPRVIQLRDQLAQVQTSLRDEIRKIADGGRNSYLIARARENLLRSALEEQKKEANRMLEDAIQYRILKHDVESNQQLYEGLLQRLKEASVSAGLNSSRVSVVDSASVPRSPAKPNIPLNLALGLLLGCFAGSTAVFVFDRFDNKIRTPDEVEALVALPGLTTIIPVIPRIIEQSTAVDPAKHCESSEANVAALIAYLRPNSNFAECYRALRTSLLLASPNNARVIVVTSPLSKEGKSTTSVNLAVVLAQMHKRVLLIDADLRAPSIHKLLHLPRDRGLSTILNPGFKGGIADYVFNSQVPGVFVLPAGPTPDLPTELLGSDAMKGLVTLFRTNFDYVVIDTAPVLAASDPIVIAADADAVLLAVRSGQTTKDAVLRAHDLLRNVGAKVAGIVVNAVDVHSLGIANYRLHSYERCEKQGLFSNSIGR
jgi:polysaccharide biosynthesis transport protein